MDSLTKRTMQIPFTDMEWQQLNYAVLQSGYKKQNYIRNVIVADLKKNGWLPQNQEEKTAQIAAKEV